MVPASPSIFFYCSPDLFSDTWNSSTNSLVLLVQIQASKLAPTPPESGLDRYQHRFVDSTASSIAMYILKEYDRGFELTKEAACYRKQRPAHTPGGLARPTGPEDKFYNRYFC